MSQSSGSHAISLAGTNDIIATHSGMARVRLAEDVKLPFDRCTHKIKLEGRGRMVSFLLTRSQQRFGSPSLAGVRMNFCPEEGCAGGDRFNFACAPFGRKLPAGDYLLYVVTDGAPVRFKLGLPGLPGGGEIRLAGGARSETANPPTSLSFDPSSQTMLESGGLTRELDGLGLGYVASWTRGEDHAGGVGLCYQNGEPLVPEPLGWGPEHCPHPGAGSYAIHYVKTPDKSGRKLALGMLFLSPATWGLGGWYASVGDLDDSGLVTQWLWY